MEDPLNISIETTGVETDFPLLPEGDYFYQVVESAPKANKDNTGYNWNLKLALRDPATAIDGRPIAVNTLVFMLIALQSSGKEGVDPEGFKRNIAQALDAIFATTKENRPAFNKATWEAALGKVVKAHIYIDDYQGRKSNKVKTLKVATAA